MIYQFPKTKFVTNDLSDQLGHVTSEALEAMESYARDEAPVETAIELLDVIHSAETALRILLQQNRELDLDDLHDHVIAKNSARGYYDGQKL